MKTRLVPALLRLIESKLASLSAAWTGGITVELNIRASTISRRVGVSAMTRETLSKEA